MDITWLDLLAIQRDLYRLPRNYDRFREYLQTMIKPDGTGLELPLVAMNPMAHDHVPALLDQYLALDADRFGREVVAELVPELAGIDLEIEVGLVMADDLRGGWTNRYSTELQVRAGGEARPSVSRWAVGLLWSSEPASLITVGETLRCLLWRLAWHRTTGVARTLDELLTQEGWVLQRAGCTGPVLDPDDLAYTREVLAPHRQASDQATWIAALFGDAGAQSLGHQPLGLSDRAGLALALAEAQAHSSP
jgi:hypothetical protein